MGLRVTRITAAVDQLVAVLDAGTAADVTVYDGPVVTEDIPQKRIYVGYDHEGISVEGDQSWAGSLGTAKRDENFSVHCMIAVDDGDGVPKTARDAVFAVWNDVSTTLRTSANVSLGLPSPTLCQLRSPVLTYTHEGNVGITARISFAVQVQTRI
jgi:hypothetical protein